MAKFTVIKRSDMPETRKQGGRLGARMKEYDRYILGLKGDEAGKLVPSESETARGIALRISRAAKRNGKSVDVRTVDGAIYFALDNGS
ncbi:MAG: hypothetical protein HYX53_03725 [Chloroflexi bacterium]|nr:hypothetical protein [Chloroflexota bacterium]